MVGIKNQKRMVEKVNALLLMTSKGLFSHVFPIHRWLWSLLVAGFWLGRSPVAISCSCTDCHSSCFLPKDHHVLLCIKRYSKLCCSLIRSLNHLFLVFLRCKRHKLSVKVTVSPTHLDDRKCLCLVTRIWNRTGLENFQCCLMLGPGERKYIIGQGGLLMSVAANQMNWPFPFVNSHGEAMQT